MRLCDNCHEENPKRVQIGADKGTQRDPWWDMIDLCDTCKGYLASANLCGLFDRHECKIYDDVHLAPSPGAGCVDVSCYDDKEHPAHE